MVDLTISVSIIEAKGLKKKESGKYDPYVEVRYNNSNKLSHSTKVVKNTTTPFWDDRFDIKLDNNSQEHSLTFTVWDKEVFFLTDNFIGSIVLDVNKIGVPTSSTLVYDTWLPLVTKDGKDTTKGGGELHLSIKQKKPIDDLPLDNWVIFDQNCNYREVTFHELSKTLDRFSNNNNRNGDNDQIVFQDVGIDQLNVLHQSSSNQINNDNSNNNNNHQMVDENDMLFICIICRKRSNSGQGLYLMDDCLHNCCTNCLTIGFKNQIQHGILNITCPVKNCTQSLSHLVLKEILPKNEYETYLNKTLELVFESNPGYFKCPNASCNIVFERMQPQQPQQQQPMNRKLNLMSPDGKKMKEEAALHRDEFRFRCTKCSTEFCSDCKSTPYHYGFTCQSHRLYLVSKKCRYCKEVIPNSNVSETHTKDVCLEEECQQKSRLACFKQVHPCGHRCMGVAGEERCLPCLKQKCIDKSKADLISTKRNSLSSPPLPIPMASASDFCNICWSETLSAAPCIMLTGCGHVFHYTCVESRLNAPDLQRTAQPRLTFQHLDCPLCNKQMKHPALELLMKPHLQLLDLVKAKATQRLVYEGLQRSKELEIKTSKWYKNPEGFAMDRYQYYPCYKCKSPYFAGMVRCDQGIDTYKLDELLCENCRPTTTGSTCTVHGVEYMEFKCHYCCSKASWVCWSKIRFCDDCHKKQQGGDYLTKKPIEEIPKCPGKEHCPLKIDHPHLEEVPLGCTILFGKLYNTLIEVVEIKIER
ncbi:hypothetical protein DFA_07317 [Cavenderia fasciculata]|uniref:C2 domain-containing protein n=1 Tax=Cavenderia fasciculata TaxID=261658 RepID=F4PW33_CACFS|nr:uncharacterized protein DFA_07317 [Cavenderia fasciculata]EGG20197.1 hypothetical protein DFA_07317 [Cavenderia fasciculata]|eukprot:XP_004367180.1 hypothetical protein DFA_07317 [Cavenderia fasciculata]